MCDEQLMSIGGEIALSGNVVYILVNIDRNKRVNQGYVQRRALNKCLLEALSYKANIVHAIEAEKSAVEHPSAPSSKLITTQMVP